MDLNFLQQLLQGSGEVPQAAADFGSAAQTVPQFQQVAQDAAPPPAAPAPGNNALASIMQGIDPSADQGAPPAALVQQNTPQNMQQAVQQVTGADGNPVPAPPPAPAPVPQAQPGFAPLQPAPQPGDDTARPKVRSSLIDHIGRLADVFATVGGYQPLYQQSLDRNQQRQLAMDDHARAVQTQGQEFTKGQNELQDHSNKLLGLVTKSLTQIQSQGGDPTKALGVLAQQVGLDPQHTATLTAAIQADPSNLGAINTALNKADKSEYGLAPVYLRDANGNVKLVQLSKDGTITEPKLPDGFQPAGNVTQVDQGPQKSLVDTRSGKVVGTLGVDGKPAADEIITRDASGKPISAAPLPGSKLATDNLRDDRKVDIQQQNADKKPAGKAGEQAGDAYTAYHTAVQGAQTIYQRLATLRASGDIDRATGLIQSQLPTQARANLRAAVAEIKGKVVPQAVSTLKQSGLSRPAQAEVLATANGMVSDLERYDQTPAQYRDKLDHAMTFFANLKKNLDAAAIRNGVVKQPGAPAPAPKPAAPAAKGGWGKATVVGN